MLPFLSFDAQDEYRDELLQAIQRVVDSKWFVLGSELANFEQEYAHLHGVRECVGVASGLDALIIALKSLEVGVGDEVIVPSNTYIATWLAVSAVGAIPVPVEPNPRTYNLDPSRLESAITSATKAVIPVHLYGQACDMSRISLTARKHGLSIIEDNAQAHLATWKGRLTGSFGSINATSFYPSKNLGAFGDSGALTTDDVGLAHRARLIRNYGSGAKYFNEIKGMNSRLDEVQAAVLRVKLGRLVKATRRRQDLARLYTDFLQVSPSVTVPSVQDGATHVFHLYVIQCDDRDGLKRFLSLNGVESMIHYPVAPHEQAAYSDLRFQSGDFPIAEAIARRALSLPLYPGMKDSDIEKVADLVSSYFGGN